MIDIDKVKAAFAANPSFCQQAWHKPGDGDNPAALCAVSALLSYAGVHPDLIGVMNTTMAFAQMHGGFYDFAAPVLRSYYGIAHTVSERIPGLFDDQANEWKGVTAVIALCERENEEERTRPTTPLISWDAYPTGYGVSFAAVWSTKVFSIDDGPQPTDWLSTETPKGLLSVGPQSSAFGVPVNGDVLDSIALSLGTGGIVHPSQHIIDGLMKPPPLLSLSVPPDQKIIEPAYSLAHVYDVKVQPQLIGSVTEWSS